MLEWVKVFVDSKFLAYSCCNRNQPIAAVKKVKSSPTLFSFVHKLQVLEARTLRSPNKCSKHKGKIYTTGNGRITTGRITNIMDLMKHSLLLKKISKSHMLTGIQQK